MILSPVTLEDGERYGKLTVLAKIVTKKGRTRYRVGCECGYSGMLCEARQLMSGKVKQCIKCRGEKS